LVVSSGTDRADCMRKLKEEWARFADDDANLTMFLAEKRRARPDDEGIIVMRTTWHRRKRPRAPTTQGRLGAFTC
jgi:hypothetical protein